MISEKIVFVKAINLQRKGQCMKETKEYAQDSSYIEYLVDRIDELSLKRRVAHELYVNGK